MNGTNRRANLRPDGEDHITSAIREAMRQVIEDHYRTGDSIVIWRDGEVIHVPPEEIPALLAASDAASGSPERPLDGVTSRAADR